MCDSRIVSVNRLKFSLLSALACLFLLPSSSLASLDTDYEHPLAKNLSIQSLDIVVSVQGPPKKAVGDFDLKLPSVLSDESRLFLPGFVEQSGQAALRNAIGDFCNARKIACSFVSGASASLTSSTTVSLVESSTTTLSSLLPYSTADAVLIVQAYVVDEFTVDQGAGNTVVETPQGRELLPDFRPELRRGRLYLAQGFLFDRETGIRLWSRRAPDYPSTNRLTVRHPFLKYGLVSDDKDKDTVVSESAIAFTQAFFSTFLRTEKFDDSDSRTKLRTVDRRLIEAKLRLADQRPFALQLEVGWTRLSFALPATLFGDTSLPEVGPESVTPNGIFTARPSLTLFADNESLWNVAVPVYMDLNPGFARTYYQDEPRENVGLNARPRLVNVQYEGLFGWGLEGSFGLRFLVHQSLMVSTMFGLFFDSLSLTVAPAELAIPNNISRFGALGSGEVTYFGQDGPENGFFSAAIRLKTGFDSQGFWILDPIFTLGAGILL